MKTTSQIMTDVMDLMSLEMEISFKGRTKERRDEADAKRETLISGLAQYDRVRELAERIMTEHWDFASCPCTFCVEGRILGLGPKRIYPTNPKVSILDDWSKEQKRPIYDWTTND